jgi:hypothetical protein
MSGSHHTGDVRPALLAVLAAYCLIASEWLFFATKPSLFSALDWGESAIVLAVAPLLPALGWGLVALIPAGLAVLLPDSLRPLLTRASLLVPALLLAAWALLLVENFTHTLFGVSMGSFPDLRRFGYAITFIGAILALTRTLGRAAISTRLLACSCAVLLAASLLAAALGRQVGHGMELPAQGQGGSRLPNILIFSTDGLDASSMSAYGYARKTTPFIDSLLDESLVFENHLTNSAKTTGAVGALLTGKLPTKTRLIFRPDRLRGEDVYQHLPGILRNLGYHNGDFSVRHYADAFDLNLRGGFHYANGRSLDDTESGLRVPRSIRISHPNVAAFLDEVHRKLRGRIRHMLGLEDLTDPYRIVMQLDHTSRGTDLQRMTDLSEFLERAPRPFFAHVHLLGTHGPRYYPVRRFFSKDREQKGRWMEDFYDDAIMDYDRYVGQVFALLRSRQELEATIVILTTDHGKSWGIDRGLPLIIRFPGAGRTGTIRTTSQRIDVAPTILDAIGIATPDWMSGSSLLQEDLDRRRPIVMSNRTYSKQVGGWRQVPNPRPPFYTLGSVAVASCQHLYELSLRRGTLRQSTIQGHTQPCAETLFENEMAAREFLVEHLRSHAFDVSSLELEQEPN